MAPPARPPFDAELAPIFKALPLPPVFTLDLVPVMRPALDPPVSDILAKASAPLQHRDVRINEHVTLAIFQTSAPSKTPKPCFYWIHGGGMMLGTNVQDVSEALEWTIAHNAVCVSVSYRLAPEHPHPAPITDCYSGLVWTAANAAKLGIDANRIIVAGYSAGGGLAAGINLMARDKQGPKILAQCLVYPMLDDRNNSVSSQQYDIGTWSSGSNAVGWKALLGEKAGGKDGEVSIYAAPARAKDLSGLPEAWVDVGSAEVFRDENVEYASKLWAAGVQCELHVWPGGWHGFDQLAPQAVLSKRAFAARKEWVKRILDEAQVTGAVQAKL